MGHKDAVDSVRAISALVVAASHVIQIFVFPVVGLGTWTHRTNSFLSETAVIVFFVLSGYLICASIISNIRRNGTLDLLDYTISRFSRIFPPLVFAVITCLVVYGIIIHFNLPGSGKSLKLPGDLYVAREVITVTAQDIYNVFVVRNGLLDINGPLWSLYIEIKLYAVAGLLAYAVWGRGRSVIRVAVVVLCLAAFQRMGLALGPGQTVYAVWWCVGAIFVLMQKFRLGSMWPGLAALGASAVVIVVLSDSTLLVEAGRIVAVFALAGLMFFRWNWSEKYTKRIADYSYTLYLVHFPILILGYALFGQWVGTGGNADTARWAFAAGGAVAAIVIARSAALVIEDTPRIKAGLDRLLRGKAASVK